MEILKKSILDNILMKTAHTNSIHDLEFCNTCIDLECMIKLYKWRSSSIYMKRKIQFRIWVV